MAGIAPEYEERDQRCAEARPPAGAGVAGWRRGLDEDPSDARLYAGLLDGDESAELPLAAGRRAWVHVARGEIVANGQTLKAGDALALSDEVAVKLSNGKTPKCWCLT